MTKPLKPAVKLIREARRLLKRGWTKGFMARDKNGAYAHYTSKEATCWCLVGALNRATKGGGCDVWLKVISEDNIYKVFGTYAMHRINDMAKDVEEVLSYLKHLEDLCA
jgi:hypothetical protein